MKIRVLCALLLLTACGELKTPTDPGGGDPVDQSATFTRVQAEVLTSSCARAGCHDAIGQSEGLVLTPGQAYANLVNRASVQMPSLVRVAPNDPDASYLYRKITGVGITGGRMPLGFPPLSDERIRLVREWIRRGAPND